MLDRYVKHTLQSAHAQITLQEVHMSSVQPFRCFDWRANLASLGVAAWLLASAWLGHNFDPASAPRILLALGQAGAIVLLGFLLARSVARPPDPQQRLHHEALAGAAAIVITAIAAWAFLEWAGLPPIDWSVGALPAFTVAWA